jgi:hypothetical protein
MAEIAAGFAGAATALAAVKAAVSGGFAGRHEATHHSELAEVDRNFHRYRSVSNNIQFHEVGSFYQKLNTYVSYSDAVLCLPDRYVRSQENLKKYYLGLNDYKDESWFNLSVKLDKRRAVRKRKRTARDANQDLRGCVDVRAHAPVNYHRLIDFLAGYGNRIGCVVTVRQI